MSPGVTPWTSTTASSSDPGPTETGRGDNGGGGNDDDGDSGLSGGAIAGIVVGSLAVVLAFAGVFFCLFWRKRNAANAAVPPTGPPVSQVAPASPGISEMPSVSMHPAAMQNQQHMSMYGGSVYDPNLSPAMAGAAFPNGAHDPRYSHMSGYSPQPQSLTPQSIPAQGLAPVYGVPQHPSPDMHSSQTSTPPIAVAAGYPAGTTPPPAQQQSSPAAFEMDASQAPAAPPAELASEPIARDNQHIPDYVSRPQ